MRNFTFISEAKDARTLQEKELYPKLEKLGVWTDGLGIHSEYQSGDYAAFRFKKGKRYKICIREID